MNKKKPSLKVLNYVLGTLFLAVAIIIHMATSWVIDQFETVDFSIILFHLKVPLEGSNTSPFRHIIIVCIIWVPILTLIALCTAIKSYNEDKLIIQIRKLRFKISLNLWNRFYALICVGILMVSTLFNARTLGLDKYVVNQLSHSGFFEENYIAPESVAITFPEEKRNLIYIFVESMEDTYASTEYGGAMYDNLITELVDLELENVNFTTSKQQLNGAYVTYGASWTMGAMVTQTAGVPLIIPIDGNSMDRYSTFLPGCYAIGEVLKDQGYVQEFLLGSDIVFGGRELYMNQHGDYKILDYNYALENSLIPEDYYVFWGYEDEKLYDTAKSELLELSQSDEPFNLTMLTVDTHFVDGYYCELCEENYDDQYSNVIACSSRQLYYFVRWIQEQDFYENTTIVICGDHLTMDNPYLEAHAVNYQDYNRTVYTTIINSAVEYSLEYDRTFTTFDLYPTTLAALGADIEGNHLGLGINLFADIPTLIETSGLEELDSELSKTSVYYTNNLLCE